MILEDLPPGELYQKKFYTLTSEVGNRLTAADVCVSYHLFWCTLWPERDVIVQKHPSVVSYLNRFRQLPRLVCLRRIVYSPPATARSAKPKTQTPRGSSP